MEYKGIQGMMGKPLAKHIAVANDAIQTMEGKEGVFVKHGESYEFTAIEKGASFRPKY